MRLVLGHIGRGDLEAVPFDLRPNERYIASRPDTKTISGQHGR